MSKLRNKIYNKLPSMSSLAGVEEGKKVPHPIHGSTTGENFHVNGNRWFCFRKGHKCGGSKFEWIALEKGLIDPSDQHGGISLPTDTFLKVLRIAGERVGIPVNLSDMDTEEWKKKKKEKEKLREVWDFTIRYYRDKLENDERIKKWVKEKYGFTDKTLERFNIGYAPIDNKFKKRLFAKFGKELSKKSGLLTKSKGEFKQVFKGRVVFPYFKRGKSIYFIGRKTLRTPDKPWEKGKYRKIPTKDKKHPYISEFVREPIYGIDSITGEDQIILTEGITDCISALDNGFPCIAPVTIHFKQEDIEKVKRELRDKEVYVCMDNEESGAGLRGAINALKTLHNDCYLVELLREKNEEKIDLNDYFRVGNTKEDFKELMEEAKTKWEALAKYGEEDLIDLLKRVAKLDYHSKREEALKDIKPVLEEEGKDITLESMKKDLKNIRKALKRERREKEEDSSEGEKKEKEDSINKIEGEERGLKEVKEDIKEEFPDLVEPTEACLSNMATIFLNNVSICPALNLVGPPSTRKTTALSFFYDFPLAIKQDKFTTASFVSHDPRKKDFELEDIDLLPRLKNKALVIPDLGVIWNKRAEKRKEAIGLITRALDGEGLEISSGVHGTRGYHGDYRFVWLGATVPMGYQIWKDIGKFGHRLYFYRMEGEERTEEEDIDLLMKDKSYRKKVNKCREAVHGFLKRLLNNHEMRGREWNTEGDNREIVRKITRLAEITRRLRGVVQTWKKETEDEEAVEFEYEVPMIEGKERVMDVFYSLAQGHAFIEGREKLDKSDLDIITHIALSSARQDRVKLLKAMIEERGLGKYGRLAEELNCSKATVTRKVKELEVLGILKTRESRTEKEGRGRPETFIEFTDEVDFLEEDWITKRAISEEGIDLGNYEGVEKEILKLMKKKEVTKEGELRDKIKYSEDKIKEGIKSLNEQGKIFNRREGVWKLV